MSCAKGVEVVEVEEEATEEAAAEASGCKA